MLGIARPDRHASRQCVWRNDQPARRTRPARPPADSPAKSVQDLVALARAQPGGLNFASGGNGSQAHFGGEMFKQLAAVDIVHVPECTHDEGGPAAGI